MLCSGHPSFSWINWNGSAWNVRQAARCALMTHQLAWILSPITRNCVSTFWFASSHLYPPGANLSRFQPERQTLGWKIISEIICPTFESLDHLMRSWFYRLRRYFESEMNWEMSSIGQSDMACYTRPIETLWINKGDGPHANNRSELIVLQLIASLAPDETCSGDRRSDAVTRADGNFDGGHAMTLRGLAGGGLEAPRSSDDVVAHFGGSYLPCRWLFLFHHSFHYAGDYRPQSAKFENSKWRSCCLFFLFF